jgi:Flp pilus assembly pilin Flp
MFRNLWKDDAGVVSLEYLLLSVIVGLGSVVGATSVSDALNAEYVELGQAILALDTSYSTNLQFAAGINQLGAGVLAHKAGTFTTDANGAEFYVHVGATNTSTGTGIFGASP